VLVDSVDDSLDKAWLDKVKAIDRNESRLKLGTCVLARPECAEIVENALLYYRGKGFLLHAWCVMPNHVHAMVTTDTTLPLNDWLESVKKFSARRINEVLGTQGSLWERESFNHLVRSMGYFGLYCEYVEANPVDAGLCESPGSWPFSSARTGAKKDALDRFVSPYDSAYVEPKDRGELTHIIKPEGTYFVTFRLLDSVVIRNRR
jgi:REP element-mobilizing transposase RayT